MDKREELAYRMKVALQKEDYERAAQIRDQINQLEE
jgi:protein-arginine kinase activator protein McsA